MIFTLPALVILGFWEDFNYLWVTLIAAFGGVLGVLFARCRSRFGIVSAATASPRQSAADRGWDRGI